MGNNSNASNATGGPNSNANSRTHSPHASNVLSPNSDRNTMMSQASSPISRHATDSTTLYSGAKPSVKVSLHSANTSGRGENEHEHGETKIRTDSEYKYSIDEDDDTWT